MNGVSAEEVVESIQLDGEEFLSYPTRPIDVAFVGGKTAGAEGNVTMEHEAATLDSLSLVQAAERYDPEYVGEPSEETTAVSAQRLDPRTVTGRPPWQRQREPLWPATRRRRRFHRHQSGRARVLTLDGLTIEGHGEAESIVRLVDGRLGELESGVVVDCDGFDPGSPGAVRFLQLLFERERSRSWAWYCTAPVGRRKLSRACSDAGIGAPIHRSFHEAAETARNTRVATITG